MKNLLTYLTLAALLQATALTASEDPIIKAKAEHISFLVLEENGRESKISKRDVWVSVYENWVEIVTLTPTSENPKKFHSLVIPAHRVLLIDYSYNRTK
jgi:hypothetical protein